MSQDLNLVESHRVGSMFRKICWNFRLCLAPWHGYVYSLPKVSKGPDSPSNSILSVIKYVSFPHHIVGVWECLSLHATSYLVPTNSAPEVHAKNGLRKDCFVLALCGLLEGGGAYIER